MTSDARWSRRARVDLLCGLGILASGSYATVLVDSFVGPRGQAVCGLVLGAVTVGWLILRESTLVRAQVAIAALLACAVEVAATQWLGLWDYRLGGLPGWLPSQQANTFLMVLVVARSLPPRLPDRLLLGCAVFGVGLWTAANLLLSQRTDTASVIWFLVLLALCRHRQTAAWIPTIVVLTVPLDILVTRTGLLAYRPHDVTGLLLIGEQPSAIVGGYAFIYYCALRTAPALLRLWRRSVPQARVG